MSFPPRPNIVISRNNFQVRDLAIALTPSVDGVNGSLVQNVTIADNSALRNAGARSAGDFGTVVPDADYVWGSDVDLSDLHPGDIIQFRDYRYDREIDTSNPDGSGTTATDMQERPHHTAIVESVGANGAVTVLEQNSPKGSPVGRHQLFFKSLTFTTGNKTTRITVQGTVRFFHPQAR